MQSDLLHLNEAERTQRMLNYTCPFGMFAAIAPVFRDEQVAAYLFLAMGVEERAGCDEQVLERVLEVDPKLNREELLRCLIEVPHHSRQKLEAYSELLVVLADSIEKNDLMSEGERSIGQLIQSYIKKICTAKLCWQI